MKHIFIKLFMLIFFWAVFNINTFAENNNVNISIDGSPLSLSFQPVIEGNYTLVPAKEVFESLGGKVDWKKDIEQLYVSFKDTYIMIPADLKTAFINGNRVEMDTEAKIINGNVMIPLRFISNSLGFEVEWNNDTRTANIITCRLEIVENSHEYSKSDGGKGFISGRIIDSYSLIDDSGNIVAQYPYIRAIGCSSYIYKDKDDKVGLLDPYGRVVVEAAYDGGGTYALKTYAVNDIVTFVKNGRFDIYDTEGHLKKSIDKPLGYELPGYNSKYSKDYDIQYISGSNVVVEHYSGVMDFEGGSDKECFILRLFSEKKVDGYYGIQALPNGEFTAFEKKDGKKVTLNLDGSLKYKN